MRATYFTRQDFFGVLSSEFLSHRFFLGRFYSGGKRAENGGWGGGPRVGGTVWPKGNGCRRVPTLPPFILPSTLLPSVMSQSERTGDGGPPPPKSISGISPHFPPISDPFVFASLPPSSIHAIHFPPAGACPAPRVLLVVIPGFPGTGPGMNINSFLGREGGLNSSPMLDCFPSTLTSVPRDAFPQTQSFFFEVITPFANIFKEIGAVFFCQEESSPCHPPVLPFFLGFLNKIGDLISSHLPPLPTPLPAPLHPCTGLLYAALLHELVHHPALADVSSTAVCPLSRVP